MPQGQRTIRSGATPTVLGTSRKLPRVQVGGQGYAFNPNAVSGLVSWWDFTDAQYNFTDAGTTRVAADAAQIQQSNDKVGSKNVTQAVAGQRPTWKLAQANGFAVARFAGASSQTLTNAAAATTAQPLTLFIVGSQTSKTTAGRFFDGGGTGRVLLGTTVTNGFFDMYSGAGPLQDAVDHSGAFHIYSGVYNGASSKGYVDGTQAVTGDAGSATTGSTLGIGSDQAATFLTGDIAHIFWYSGALSAANHNIIGNSLARLFNKTWTAVT